MWYLHAFKKTEINIISIASHIASAKVRWLCLSPGVQWHADLPLALKKNCNSEKPCYGQLHFFLQILLNWPSPPQVSPIYLCHTSTCVALSHVNGLRFPYSLGGFVHLENCCCLHQLLTASERGALDQMHLQSCVSDLKHSTSLLPDDQPCNTVRVQLQWCKQRWLLKAGCDP